MGSTSRIHRALWDSGRDPAALPPHDLHAVVRGLAAMLQPTPPHPRPSAAVTPLGTTPVWHFDAVASGDLSFREFLALLNDLRLPGRTLHLRVEEHEGVAYGLTVGYRPAPPPPLTFPCGDGMACTDGDVA